MKNFSIKFDTDLEHKLDSQSEKQKSSRTPKFERISSEILYSDVHASSEEIIS